MFKSSLEKQDELNVKFKVQVYKLSQLRVEVIDQHEQPLAKVNVFVSSMNKDEQKRQNLVTDSQGLVVNSNIRAGKYLIKPVLLEYRFEPIQHIVSIAHGQHQVVTLRATKYLFSLYGTLYDLAHHALPHARL